MNQHSQLLFTFLNKLKYFIKRIFMLKNYSLIYCLFLKSLPTAINDSENLVFTFIYFGGGVAIYERDHRDFLLSCLSMESNMK